MSGDGRVVGSYVDESGSFVADAAMRAITNKLSTMRLLADDGDGNPSFYLDRSERSYWECQEFENYRKELRKIDRDQILTHFPVVDPSEFGGARSRRRATPPRPKT